MNPLAKGGNHTDCGVNARSLVEKLHEEITTIVRTPDPARPVFFVNRVWGYPIPVTSLQSGIRTGLLPTTVQLAFLSF